MLTKNQFVAKLASLTVPFNVKSALVPLMDVALDNKQITSIVTANAVVATDTNDVKAAKSAFLATFTGKWKPAEKEASEGGTVDPTDFSDGSAFKTKCEKLLKSLSMDLAFCMAANPANKNVAEFQAACLNAYKVLKG